MKPGITSGKKISNSHQTIIDKAVPVLKELKNESFVEKIVIGKIKNVNSRFKKLISENTGTSIRMTVKSHGEVQEFFVIGSDLNRIERKVMTLSKAWR